MDPKLKRWETGLVCDHCGRKAVVLTLVKPGDLWDQQEWSRKYVGKRICQRCASRSLTSILTGWNPPKHSKIEIVWMFVGIVLFIVSIAAFVLAPLARISLVIPSIIFITFIGVEFSWMMVVNRWSLRKERSHKQPTTVVPPGPISIEGFFRESASSPKHSATDITERVRDYASIIWDTCCRSGKNILISRDHHFPSEPSWSSTGVHLLLANS